MTDTLDSLRAERDDARTLLASVEAERNTARATVARLRAAVACDPDEHATYLAQRDEAQREAQRTAAECDDAVAEAERDALQRRLDALAASDCLGLDATEAAAIVAELDRLRAAKERP